MARIIAVANQKGGVGKTATAINLGAALAEQRRRTLLVDLDPQGALSVGLGVNAHGLDQTIYNALVEPGFLVSTILHRLRPDMDLLPANIDLALAEVELISELRREFALANAIGPLDARYAYVLIDCPPSLGLLTTNALCVAREVLIPMQCEYFSMRAIRMLLEIIRRIKGRLNPGLEIGGILPTLYATGTIHAREVLDEIRSVFGPKVYDVVIYKSIRFAEANVAHEPILDYAPTHKGAQAYRQLAQILIEQEGGSP
jgi:chromosome partitioning protein